MSFKTMCKYLIQHKQKSAKQQITPTGTFSVKFCIEVIWNLLEKIVPKMDKIYKKYRKSGSYYRKLKNTREKYEIAMKHLFSGTYCKDPSETRPRSTGLKCSPDTSRLSIENPVETFDQTSK